jgi:hypothetical protein
MMILAPLFAAISTEKENYLTNSVVKSKPKCTISPHNFSSLTMSTASFADKILSIFRPKVKL